MPERIKLRVMGLSYSPMQSGAFALLLAVDGDSPVRIPVVIGAPEAQSIAVTIEGVNSPRPMTHDRFATFARSFGIRLTEVFIYRFEDGIYSSEMTFTDGDRQVVLDARTSDAVSIAMRTGAPIYTTPAIVDECGIELEEVTTATDNDDVDADDEEPADDGLLVAPDPETVDLPDGVEENLDDETLQRRMQFFAEHDDYESAMRIRAILAARGKNASNG